MVIDTQWVVFTFPSFVLWRIFSDQTSVQPVQTTFLSISRRIWGTAVAQWLRCCATNRKVACFIPDGVSGFFINIKSFRSHYGPGVDSASNRNEYRDYFLVGKDGRCVRLTTLPPSCSVVTNSWSLNFQEPSGPVQACNGTALPFLRRIFEVWLCLFIFWTN